MKFVVRVVLSLMLVLSVSVSVGVAGSTYHVRMDGDDTNCNGSSSAAYPGNGGPGLNCAFRTIRKAVNAVTGTGNTILIHSGTYTECTTDASSGWKATLLIPPGKSGAAAAYNVIKAANDGLVTLNGNSTCDRAILVLGTSNTPTSYWQIGSLEPGEGLTIGGEYPVPNPGTTSGTVHVDNFSRYIRFYGNTITGNTYHTSGCSSAPDTDEIRMGASTCIGCEVVGNDVTLNGICTALDFSQRSPCYGCTCTDLGFTVARNRFQIDLRRINYPGGGRNFLAIHGTKGVLIDRNYFEYGDATHQSADALSYALYNRSNCNWTVSNNYFQANAPNMQVIYMQEGTGPVDPNNHKYYNNTIYGRADIGFQVRDCDNCELRNNAFVGYSSSSKINEGVRLGSANCEAEGFVGPVGYNNFYNVNTSYVYWCGTETDERPFDSTANPVFMGSGAFPVPFLRLQPTSPLIGKACDRTRNCPSTPTLDFDGEIRANPGAIGSDENVGPADSTPPAGTQNLRRTDKQNG